METRSEQPVGAAAAGANDEAPTTRATVKSPRASARRWALKMIEGALRELDKSGDLATDPEVADACAEIGTYLGRAAPSTPRIPDALVAWMEEVDRALERIERNSAPGLGALLRLLGDRLDRAESNADHLHDDVMAMREWMRIPRPGCYPKNRRAKVRRLRARKG